MLIDILVAVCEGYNVSVVKTDDVGLELVALPVAMLEVGMAPSVGEEVDVGSIGSTGHLASGEPGKRNMSYLDTRMETILE